MLRRKWARRLGLTLLLSAAAGVLAVLYLRADKTAVFHRVRGEYREARVLAVEERGESRLRLLQLVNDRGEAVATAYVRRPHRLVEDYAIVLTYAGAKTGDRILALIPERPDVVLAAVQYPYHNPQGLVEHLRWPYDVRRAAFRTVAGGMLAVSFLERDEGLDLGRLTVVGASLGTAFATLHGALDPRVPRVFLLHGGGDFPAVLAAIQRRQNRAWLAAPSAWGAAVLFHTFDPVHWVGRIAPREVRMVATRHDRYFPVASIEALYQRAGEPKSLVWTDTDHVRSSRSAIAEDLVRRVAEYLDRADPESLAN